MVFLLRDYIDLLLEWQRKVNLLTFLFDNHKITCPSSKKLNYSTTMKGVTQNMINQEGELFHLNVHGLKKQREMLKSRLTLIQPPNQNKHNLNPTIGGVASRLYMLSLYGLSKPCGTNTPPHVQPGCTWRWHQRRQRKRLERTLDPRESYPRPTSDTMLKRIKGSNLKPRKHGHFN